MIFARLLLLSLGLLFQPGHALALGSSQALWPLMAERLAVSVDVARAKWNNGAAVEDSAREAAILDQVASRAPEHGVDPAQGRGFFRAQMEAGKLIQRALLAEWSAQRHLPFDPVPDLGRDIRPRLDQLTPRLLAALPTAGAPPEPARIVLEYPAPAGVAVEVWLKAWEVALSPLGRAGGGVKMLHSTSIPAPGGESPGQ